MGEPREIDRLIEEGLLLYGQGQLDAALMIWEQALSVDPDNPQANSYVDYVRMNYELLTNDSGTDEPSTGFGLDDEPYQVEVGPGEIATAGAPAHADAADEGWFIEGELSTRGARGGDEPGPEPPSRTVQMEADEPPEPVASEPARAPITDKPVSFDDETREYPKGERPKISVVAEPDPRPDSPPVHLSHITDPGLGLPERPPAMAFPPEGTATAAAAPSFPVDREFDGPELTPGPAAFQSLPTETKRRDLGFVQPRAELPLPPPATDEPPNEMELPQRRHRKTGPPPELKMTLRTPFRAEEPPPPDPEIPTSDPGASPQSSTNAPTAELDPREPGPRIAVELAAAAALVNTLPTPLRSSRAITPVAMPPPPPLPAIARPPSTRMMSGEISIPDLPIESSAPTRELPMSVLPSREDLLVSAPTRELGMRPPFVPIRTAEDDPTKELVRGAKPPGVISRLEPAGAIVAADAEGTRQEPPPAFDPIETRSMQILDEVDAGAAEDESKDDRTRRRITALLDHAVEWSRRGELDKAVSAVDLALAEDPNAALAQKLIHRNRDTIMAVFQSYIGDLDRTPVLAKPLHELAKLPISPRAAFLLSRVDGALTLDEILDVSGMPRLEAYRYLSQLLLRGILR